MSITEKEIIDQEDEVLSDNWVVVRHKVTGKFWGILYNSAYAKAYGWCEKLDPYLISDYNHVTRPEDAPHRTEKERLELMNNGTVVHVELLTA